MKHFLSIIIALFTIVPAWSQTGMVAGYVQDEAGIPLAGVSVVIKGTKVGTMSDGDGNFSIKVSSFPATLTFSFLGMEADDVVVKGSDKDITVTMREAGLSIEHTVITGYTQTSTKKITGSVSVLTSKSLEEKVNTSVDAMLQGQLAGVSVTATSGQPGRSQEIRIRGQSTLT